MNPRQRDRRRLPTFLLAGLLFGSGGACTQEPGEQAPRSTDAPSSSQSDEPPTTIDRVALRLGPEAFVDVPTPLHGPVVQIGDEARPVVRSPDEILVAEVFGVVPSEGVARADISLPPETSELPDAAFVLSVQELPFTQALEEEVMARIARENFSLRRDRGWRLVRGEDGAARLEIDHEGSDAVQLNLHLTAQLPAPSVLESRPFEVPPGARMGFGLGVSGSDDTADAASVEFAATLLCEGQEPHELVRDRISPAAGPAAWKNAEAPLPSPGATCRLRLEQRGDAEAESRGVWAVPKIFAPDQRGDDDVNLILVSLDTLRSDHLSGLGYARETSPIIDTELIAKGTTFTDTSSTFPQTDVSHLSLFTGLYPAAQPKRGRVSAADRLVLLAEELQRGGLETAAFTENALVSGAFGFWFGFDQFTERSFDHADRGRPTFDDGIAYVEANRDRRFFLFLHTYKTHDPYVPGAAYEALWSDDDAWEDGGPAPWIPEKHRDILDRYDRTIREADDLVGQLLTALGRLGLERRTIIVVTSDHGEAFGEHGLAGHGFSPHQEALDVPLIFRGPGVPAGRRIDTPVSIVDLPATVLDLLGLPAVSQSQGVSLAPAFSGQTLDPARPLFFSWLRPDAYGVRTGSTKFHSSAKGHEQFDLSSDPNEWQADRSEEVRAAGEPVLTAHHEEAARLRESLGPVDSTDGPSTVRSIDKRLERSLEALGYLE